MKKFLLLITFVALLAGCQRKTADSIVIAEQSFETFKTLPAKVITGEITYLQRIALETPYRVELEIYEVDGDQRISVGEIQDFMVNHQVPISFIFSYNDDLITPQSKEYGLEARIYRIEDGRLEWRNSTLTNPFSVPFDQLEIIVNQVL